jgi:hypothetical protein
MHRPTLCAQTVSLSGLATPAKRSKPGALRKVANTSERFDLPFQRVASNKFTPFPLEGGRCPKGGWGWRRAASFEARGHPYLTRAKSIFVTYKNRAALSSPKRGLEGGGGGKPKEPSVWLDGMRGLSAWLFRNLPEIPSWQPKADDTASAEPGDTIWVRISHRRGASDHLGEQSARHRTEREAQMMVADVDP